MMNEDQIKEFVFDYIRGSEDALLPLISQKRFAELGDKILSGCYDATTRENEAESAGVLATAMLHYLLTCALVPSQRKVELGGVDLDIVIPDLKTLRSDAKRALVICIPKTLDAASIKEKIADLQKIQPHKDNILLVLSKEMNLESKTYVISKKGSTFACIMHDVVRFADLQGINKFKILRI